MVVARRGSARGPSASWRTPWPRRRIDPPDDTALGDLLRATLPDVHDPVGLRLAAERSPSTPTARSTAARLPAPPADASGARRRVRRAGRRPAAAHAARIFAEVLGVDRVGARDDFFDLGGNSLLALRAGRAPWSGSTASRCRSSRFFEHTDAARRSLATSAGAGQGAPPPGRVRAGARRGATVAIVGMAGRFPGADDVERALAEPLRRRATRSRPSPRRSSIRRSRPRSERRPGVRARARRRSSDVDCSTPPSSASARKEAELMDPQQRLFLEVAWEALESARATCPRRLRGAIGVFAGMYNATYYQKHVSTRPDLVERLGRLPGDGRQREGLRRHPGRPQARPDGPGAQRPHRLLDVARGDRARRSHSLRSHECDVALAGGSSVTCPREQRLPLPGRGDALARTGTRAPSTPQAQRHRVQRRRRPWSCSGGSRTRCATATRSTRVIRGAAVNNDGARQGELHRAERRRAGGGRRARRTEMAGVDPRTHLLRRDARHGDAAGRPHRGGGADPGVPRGRPRTAGSARSARSRATSATGHRRRARRGSSRPRSPSAIG